MLPLLAARWLPFSDLPEHVAAIAALRQWSDPSYRIAEHYTFAIGESQYLAYPLAGAALSFVVGTAERANLVLLAATGIAWPYAARSMLRALRRDERLALFACPLFWNHALVVGLLPFVASVPLVLLGIALAVRGRTRAVAALGALLFFVHVQALVLFTLISAARIVALRRPRRSLLALVPGMTTLAAWALVARVGLRGRSLDAPGQIRFAAPGDLARLFPFWAHDLWKTHADEALAIAFWICVSAIALRGTAKRLALWLPLAVTLVAYVALPYQIGGGDMLNVRLAVFVPLFVLPVLTPRRAWPLAGAAVLTVLGAMNDAREIRLAHDEVGDLDRVLDAIPRGSRVLSLHFRIASQRTHFPSWIHVAAYHRARGGGVAEPSFAVLGHWPLHYRPEAAPPAKDVDFWEFDPCAFRNAIDGPYYDHVLVRGRIDPFAADPPGPAWTKVLVEKEWTLFARMPGVTMPATPSTDRGPCSVARGRGPSS